MLFARARELADAHASVGFVAHNPGIGELAVSLAGAGAFPDLRRMAIKYPTGAVAVLDFPVDAWDDVERRGRAARPVRDALRSRDRHATDPLSKPPDAS